MALDAVVLDPLLVQHTLGLLLKYQDDIARLQGSEAARLLEQVRSMSPQAPAAPPAEGAGPPWGGPAPGQARAAGG